MFWGVTLDSKKRYSQITEQSYHLSMAVLEPRRKGTESSDKYVSLKLEHRNAEYLLCTLQYGKVMQVSLDIVFSKGESTCFSLTGEGTVHLTGYYIENEEDMPMTLSDLSSDYTQDAQFKNLKFLAGDDDDDDDDEDDDWSPSNPKINKSLDEECSDSEEEDSGSAVDSDSVLVDSDEVKDIIPGKTLQKEKSQVIADKNVVSTEDSKRKNEVQKGNKSKKLKANSSSPVENLPKKSAKSVSKDLPVKKQVQTNDVNKDSDDDDDNDDDDEEEESDEGEGILEKIKDDDSDDDDDDDVDDDDDDDDKDSDDSENDENNSSIGRTPMPKSKDKNSAQASKSIESPSKKSPTKDITKSKAPAEVAKENDLNIPTLIPINKNVGSSTPKNVQSAKRNVGGVQIEDLRVGSGPPTKNGRFIAIHYTGKLTNGKTFDSNEPPKKPFSFRLGKGEVIKGFDIGLSGMKVGGKRKLTIPPNLAYGNKKNSGIPANSTLVFVVDLKAVN